MQSMKNTEFPLRKTFEQDFISEDARALFTLKYVQATMKEYHEFFAMSHVDQIKELYELIRKQIPLTRKEKLISLIFKWFRGKLERSLDIDLIIQNILANKFRTYESIYESVAHLRQSSGKQKKSLFSANMSIVCQKYCISPVELFENFPLEQYMWLQDGVLFNLNETDKEWQAENQLALVDREEVKKRAEETRKAFEEHEKSNQ